MVALPYVYICSAGHSGSTLLDLLIGSHSQIASLGEITQLPKNLALNSDCTCGEKVRNCSLWKKVLSSLSECDRLDYFTDPYALNMGFIKAVVVKDKKHQTRFYDLKRNIYGLLLYAKLSLNIVPHPLLNPVYKGIENTFRVYELVKEKLRVSTVVDSSKTYLKAISLYATRPEQVRIILLTRDARGVIYSAVKRNRSAKKCAESWVKHYKRTLFLLNKCVDNKHWLQIRYEDLVESPEVVLKKICHFIGTEFEEQMLSVEKKVHHITNGNNMRFSGSKGITLKKDEQWKTGLKQEDIASYNRITGEINKSLGYYR